MLCQESWVKQYWLQQHHPELAQAHSWRWTRPPRNQRLSSQLRNWLQLTSIASNYIYRNCKVCQCRHIAVVFVLSHLTLIVCPDCWLICHLLHYKSTTVLQGKDIRRHPISVRRFRNKLEIPEIQTSLVMVSNIRQAYNLETSLSTNVKWACIVRPATCIFSTVLYTLATSLCSKARRPLRHFLSANSTHKQNVLLDLVTWWQNKY